MRRKVPTYQNCNGDRLYGESLSNSPHTPLKPSNQSAPGTAGEELKHLAQQARDGVVMVDPDYVHLIKD